MSDVLEKAMQVIKLREYGIITTNEYIVELNKIRVSLGYKELPSVSEQIAAQHSAHPTLCLAAFQAFVYAVKSSILTAFRHPPQRG